MTRCRWSLEHDCVTKYGRRGGGGVGVGRHVIGGQHEAVIHISGADHVLIDLVGDQIPSGRARRYPVAGSCIAGWAADHFRRSWRVLVRRRICIADISCLAAVRCDPHCTMDARRLARPIREFARAAERLGVDLTAPPLTARGPRELRTTIMAFNRMQDRLRRFLEDRTQMLAAISHDLRAPPARLRLRAEFVEDEEQQQDVR
jgi:signal transduction histidine kinase